MKRISKTVWVLSLVSLFTDMASEMLYPVMPLFLKQAGYSAIFIGILEGISEAVAGLTKSYFGKQSDRTGKRLPFVRLGYTLSAISKPMLAIFIYPWWIFLSRSMDRLGKGLRTGARDALLREESTASTRATVFGFHRSIDTLGAVLGPVAALVFLYFYPGQYQALFLLAFIPGILAVISTFLIRSQHSRPSANQSRPGFFAFTAYWKKSPIPYRNLVAGLLIFAIVNSADVFLLLKMKESGIDDAWIIGIYIFYNAIYALLAFPMGIIADKLGLKPTYLGGVAVFILVYLGFAFATEWYVFLALFALYGLYASATEGISKAWIANLVPREETATAIGTYTGFQSFAALIASSLCGFTWFYFGATTSFLLTAAVAFLSLLYTTKIEVPKTEAVRA